MQYLLLGVVKPFFHYIFISVYSAYSSIVYLHNNNNAHTPITVEYAILFYYRLLFFYTLQPVRSNHRPRSVWYSIFELGLISKEITSFKNSLNYIS